MHGFRNRHLKKMCGLEVEGCRRYGRLPTPATLSRDWASAPHRKTADSTIWKSGRLRTIYKICPASSWREAERQGIYRGSADDARDGFIHFSTAVQLPETLRKYYFGQTGLFLIAVDADALGDVLRWEPSRGEICSRISTANSISAPSPPSWICARAPMATMTFRSSNRDPRLRCLFPADAAPA